MSHVVRSVCRIVPLFLIAAVLSLGLVAPAQAAPTLASTAGVSTADGRDGEPVREPVRGISATEAATATISGLVYNQAGNQLQGILVEALAAEDPTAAPVASAFTYEEGYLLNVPQGDYVLRFSSPNWKEKWVYQTTFYGGGSGDVQQVEADAVLVLDDVVLVRDSGVPVTGTVVGPDGTTPLANVEVQLYRFFADGAYWSVAWDQTDAAGNFSLPGAKSGRDYSVRVWGQYAWDHEDLGLANIWLGDSPGPSQATKFTVPVGAASKAVGTVTLQQGVRVHGTVSLAAGDATDTDYVYVDLLLRNPDGSYDNVGYDYVSSWNDWAFEFPAAPRGATYTLEFWSAGLSDPTYLGGSSALESAQPFTLTADSPAELDLGNTVLGAQTSRVTGRVVDAEGDGIDSELRVWKLVDGEWQDFRWAWTDSNGQYRLRLPWDGTWTVEANPEALQPVFLGGGTSPADPATTTFTTGETSPTVALDDIVLPDQPGKAVGFVRDGNGDPIAGARVILWSDWCGTGCWDWDHVTTTNSEGRYVFRNLYGDDTDQFTVSAKKPNAGYDEAFLGGGDAPETATTFQIIPGQATPLGDLTLPIASGLVRGTLSTEDGGDADEKSVDLYRWYEDEWGGYFDWYDSVYLERGEFDYAFRNVPAGTYTLRGSAYDWRNDTQPYMDTWRGGAAPAGPGSPGTFEVDGLTDPLDGVDLTLLTGVVLEGIVTRGDGSPLAGAGLDVYQWGAGADAWRSYVTWGETDAEGRYSVLVPKNSEIYFEAYRNGYETYHFGGSYAEMKDEQHILHVGTVNRTFDFAMTPYWGEVESGQYVGAVAGVQDEDCLTNDGWDDDAFTFAGSQLSFNEYGELRLAKHQDVDPFDEGARDPALVPLQTYGEFPTYGIRDNGDLCVLWNEYGAIRQAILHPAAGGGLDVTFNYDHVGEWSVREGGKAGWTDGEGPGAGTTVLPGWESGGGYDDSQWELYDWETGTYPPNTETGLVHNSRPEGGQPGRYQFHFDGFEPRAAKPVSTTAPTIGGVLEAGQTLTIDPGTWTLDGAPATDLELRYTWFNTRGGDPVDNTYVVDSADRGRRLWAEVRAWAPGHDWTVVETAMVRIALGPPAAEVVNKPVISPAAPTINQEVSVDTGVWSVDGGTQDDLTFAYQWFRNGNRISGATASTYFVQESDALKELTVRVKASRPDHAPVKVFSDPVTVGDLPPVSRIAEPSLTGDPRVGSTLTLDPGDWDAGGEPVTLTYRWSADYLTRTPDAGDGTQYTLRTGDQSRLVTARVTAKAPGHRSTTWSRTVGPIAAGDAGLSPLTVTVLSEADDSPIPNADVLVCQADDWDCLPGARTDGSGVFTATAQALTDYYVYVYPPSGSSFRSGEALVSTAGPETPTATTIRLFASEPPPANVSIPTANGTYDGLPTVYWNESQTIKITGCAGVEAPTYTVTFSDGTPTQTGPMTQGAAGEDGLAVYTATIPPFYPSHGDTKISTTIPADCEEGTEPTEVNIYIDPSGVVTDQYGRPIEGATVTLLRSDDAGGPFTVVPDGSDIMSTDNRTNPDLTDGTGFFRWDVTEGWYRVQVDATGCNPFTTGVMQVPPPAIDLIIKLTCSAGPPTATPTIGGTPTVGQTLTTNPGAWDDLFEVDLQWLRGGDPIEGATGNSYELTAADVGEPISVRHVAQRPIYIQEEGRGTPVSFQSVTETSAATTAVAPGAAPVATTAPAVTGTPKVGQTLTATAPVWDTGGVTESRQWLREGVAIEGATGATYVVQPADVGQKIRVRYTATKTGYSDGTSSSDEMTGLLGDALVATTAAAVSGSGEVGTSLTATAPDWATSGWTVTRQWLNGTDPIAGATGVTYEVQPADVGDQIRVRYTATRSGYADGTSESIPITAVVGSAPGITLAPTITGTPKVGELLTATAPMWTREGVSTTFQWLRNGEQIVGATGSTYTLATADAAQLISVQTSGTQDGYAPGSATSDAVQVAKLTSTTTAKLPKAKVPAKVAPKIAVTVAVPGLTDPTGKVKIMEGKKVLKTVSLGQGGKVTITLPKLKKGKHQLVAVYTGSPTVVGSKSKAVTLTST